jgi:hypothetical protein
MLTNKKTKNCGTITRRQHPYYDFLHIPAEGLATSTQLLPSAILFILVKNQLSEEKMTWKTLTYKKYYICHSIGFTLFGWLYPCSRTLSIRCEGAATVASSSTDFP